MDNPTTRPGIRWILGTLLIALACAGLVRAESGSILHGPNRITYSVSGITFGTLKESDGWQGHSRYWAYEGGAIDGGTLTLSGSAATSHADGAWLRGFLFVNSPSRGASRREINQSARSPGSFQFSESLPIPADADRVQVSISLTASTAAMEPVQEVSLLVDATRQEGGDWTVVDDSRSSSGTAGSVGGSPGSAPDPGDGEGADGPLAVGAVLGLGALAVLGALAAAALGLAATAAARRKKKAQPPPAPDAVVGYILRLNATHFSVTLEQPAVMQVAAYRVMASGAYALAPEAWLQVVVPPAAGCLQVAPATGQGTLECRLTLGQPPTIREVGLVVTGTAGGKQVQQPVTVELRMDLELEFF